MDLFTTFIRLAGKEIPQDRIIDGGDLRQDLGIVSEAAVTGPSETVFEFFSQNLVSALRNVQSVGPETIYFFCFFSLKAFYCNNLVPFAKQSCSFNEKYFITVST